MTAVSHPDITRRSSREIYVVEARSPDNKTINHRDGSAPNPDAFGFKYGQMQCEFRYQLIHRKTMEVVWERWQEGPEPSPQALFVSDEGWVVIQTHGHIHAWLIAVSPTGEDALRVGISRDRPGEPQEKTFYIQDEHVAELSFGLSWASGAIMHFMKERDRPYFSVETSWGRKFRLDLEGGRLIEEAKR